MQFRDQISRDSQADSEGLGIGSIAIASPASLTGPAQQFSERRGIPEFSELVLACRHHLILTVLLGAIVSSASAVLVWRLTAAPYEAESMVRVRQYQDVVFAPQTSRADDAAFVRAQEQLVLSAQVLAAALSDEQVKSLSQHIPTHDSVDWLRNLLQVDIQAGAEVMSISVLHPSPRVSHALCIAVTRSYLAEITNRLASDRQRRQEELERAAQAADRQLDKLWEQLNRIASEVGSDSAQSLTIRDEIQLQAYREYAQRLRAAQMRGNELQSQLTDEPQRVANKETERLLQKHPDIVAAQDRIATIDSQIQQLRGVVARDDLPRLQRLYEDRTLAAADAERLLGDLQQQLREQSAEQHRIKMAASQMQLRKQIELNREERDFLQSRMKEIDAAVVRTDEKNGVQLEMSRHAVQRQTRLADGLWQSLEEFKIESQSQPRVTLIELAQFPQHANHGRQLKAVAGAAGVGWMIAILGIGCFEWQGCRVRNGEDVRSHSARPVFGTNIISGGLFRVTKNGSNNGAREAVARLMLPNKTSTTVPSVIVTSASAGEPRHLVSVDIARAFRDFRRQTLLIDCDTSGSFLSRQLGADHLPGLLQVGPHSMKLHQFIVPSVEDGLDFMPLGLSQGAASWIDPQTFQLVLRALRSDYDAIVVNGPAMMSSAESLLFVSHVDQTVLAVFQGTSRWNQLAATEHDLIQAGIPVFGSVLHSGKRSVPLKLKIDLPGAPREVPETEEATEESLRESIAAMQHELAQNTSSRTELPTRSASNEEVNS